MRKLRTERRDRRLGIERLEDRLVLAVVTVTDLGDGSLAALAGDGKISLREAIEAVNTQTSVDGSPAGDGNDLIQFDASMFAAGPQTLQLTWLHESSVSLGQTALRISSSVTIVGPGSSQLTIGVPRGETFNPIGRLFRIDDGIDAAASNIIISGVSLLGGEIPEHDGSAILSRENLTLSDVNARGFLALNGGGVASSIGQLTVINSRIRGQADGFGGAAYVAGGALTVTDSHIERSVGFVRGGGVYVSDAVAEIRGTTFSDNSAGTGGGLFARNAHVTISDCEVVGNDADSGGGVGAEDSTVVVVNSTLRDNNEQSDFTHGIDRDRGGGISAVGAGALYVIGGTIANNTARLGGGVYAELTGGGVASLTGVEIVDNVARSGGGLWFSGQQLQAHGVDLRRNRALGGNGGGIAAQGLDIAVIGGTIEDNGMEPGFVPGGHPSFGIGGGAWLQPHPTLPPENSRIQVSGVTFQRNTSEDAAGGLAAKAAQILIHDATFSANTAVYDGGGMYLEPAGDAPLLLLERVNVRTNKAGMHRPEDQVASAGGGVYAKADLTAIDAVVEVNEIGGKGAGIFSTGSVSLVRSTVRNNRTNIVDVLNNAIDPFSGGGIYAALDATLSESVVSGNLSRWRGGGVHAGRNISLMSSEILENRVEGAELPLLADPMGGGLFAMGSVTISHSTIRDNVAKASEFGTAFGGGVRGATVNIASSAVTGNAVEGGRLASAGGGISATVATIADSTIDGNRALGTDGYYGGGGGGVAAGTVTITGSRITNNRTSPSGYGAGLRVNVVNIDSSVLTGNIADVGRGGGAYIIERAEIVDSDISGNSGMLGGGLYVGTWSLSSGTVKRGTLILSRSTVAQNAATSSGGGLHVLGSLDVSDSTVSGNSAATGDGGIRLIGTLELNRSLITGNSGGVTISELQSPTNVISSATIRGSIIAQNGVAGLERDLVLLPYYGEFQPIAVTISHSLVGHAAGSTLIETPVEAPDANGNLIGGPVHGAIDPMLGPLANHGGPTRTHALLPGSPAIDAGDPAAQAGSNGIPQYDQRGTPYARIIDGRIDMGPYERQPPSADFNRDGRVDGADFLVWQRGMGTPAPMALKSDGDADDDGAVGGADFAVWTTSFGADVSIAAPSEVHVVAAVVAPSMPASSLNSTRFLTAELIDAAMAFEHDLQDDGASRRVRPRWRPPR